MFARSLRPLLLVLLASVAVPEDARGHAGAFPMTNTVTYQPGSSRVVFGTTFGLLISEDDGATWRWTCEESIGFDPARFWPTYAASPAGTIFANTFEGLSISRDGGCSWSYAGGALEGHWATDVQLASDGAIWVTTSSGALENDAFVSRDDGQTFTPAGLTLPRAWWKAVRVAPSNPLRVYVSGYQLADLAVDAGSGKPTPLLRRSDDGGETWTEIPFAFEGESELWVLAVSPDDPDHVHAHVPGTAKDFFLRSTDGGLSWTPVLDFEALASGTTEPVALTVLADADSDPENDRVIAGTATRGVRVSDDGGATWQEPTQEPRMTCVGERADGTLLTCGRNWAPDNFAIGRSTDRGDTWTQVLRFSQIADELDCPAGTGHATMCTPLWMSTECSFDPTKPGCGGAPDAAPVDQPDAGNSAGDDGGGGGDCGCGVGLAAAFVFIPWPRRRRRDAFPPV